MTEVLYSNKKMDKNINQKLINNLITIIKTNPIPPKVKDLKKSKNLINKFRNFESKVNEKISTDSKNVQVSSVNKKKLKGKENNSK